MDLFFFFFLQRSQPEARLSSVYYFGSCSMNCCSHFTFCFKLVSVFVVFCAASTCGMQKSWSQIVLPTSPHRKTRTLEFKFSAPDRETRAKRSENNRWWCICIRCRKSWSQIAPPPPTHTHTHTHTQENQHIVVQGLREKGREYISFLSQYQLPILIRVIVKLFISISLKSVLVVVVVLV